MERAPDGNFMVKATVSWSLMAATSGRKAVAEANTWVGYSPNTQHVRSMS